MVFICLHAPSSLRSTEHSHGPRHLERFPVSKNPTHSGVSGSVDPWVDPWPGAEQAAILILQLHGQGEIHHRHFTGTEPSQFQPAGGRVAPSGKGCQNLPDPASLNFVVKLKATCRLTPIQLAFFQGAWTPNPFVPSGHDWPRPITAKTTLSKTMPWKCAGPCQWQRHYARNRLIVHNSLKDTKPKG